MGCGPSKKCKWKKSTLGRVSQYQMEASQELDGLKKMPISLDCDNGSTSGRISVKRFHNLIYDGFYAPFLKNPFYVVVIDTRSEVAFVHSHVITARWHGHINFSEKNFDFLKFSLIVMYDQDGTGLDNKDSNLRKLFDSLRNRRFEPLCLTGGIEGIEASCPYLLTKNQFPIRERSITLNWYPLMIQEGSLYLGRADQALNPAIVRSLDLTHIVCLTDTIPIGIFPTVSYLICPLCEESPADLLQKLPTILQFMREATLQKGRLLVHCDQGVNRSPVVVMAYLMTTLCCSLEDAYYYLKGLRRVLLPTETFLQQLILYEEELYGKPLTHLEDLWL